MPNGNNQISVVIIDPDGTESNKNVKDGTKVSEVVGKGMAAILNGNEVRAGRDPELRGGDRVIVLRRAYKNGA